MAKRKKSCGSGKKLRVANCHCTRSGARTPVRIFGRRKATQVCRSKSSGRFVTKVCKRICVKSRKRG